MDSKKQILVCEDDAFVGTILKNVIASLGHEATIKINGSEGLADFKANPSKYSLILMDFFMPVMNGFQTCTAIRKLDTKIKIVGISGGTKKILIT